MAQLACVKQTMQQRKLAKLIGAFHATCVKLRVLRASEQKFTSETHLDHLKLQMFRFWQEAVDNKTLVTRFHTAKLQALAFHRLKVGTEHMSWNSRIVLYKLQNRDRNLRHAVFKALDAYASDKRRLRELYLTQFTKETSKVKALVFGQLKSYARRQSDLAAKSHTLTTMLNKKKKQVVLAELREYSEWRILR